MISFKATVKDREIIKQIAIRADYKDVAMDITACHLNGNPLRLQDLLDSDDFNFFHDIYGIRNCLNRETGKIDGMFLPRFSIWKVKQKRRVHCSSSEKKAGQ